MTELMALFGNIWFRRAALIVVVAVALYAVKEHFIHEGQQQGRLQAAQDTKAETKAEVDQAKAVYIAQANAANALVEKYAAEANAAHQQATLALQQALVISNQRQQAATGIAKVDDSHLHGYVTTSLGIRAPGDTSACYTPAEEREIAVRVVDDPLCKKDLGVMQTAVNDQAEELTKVQSQLDEINAKVTALTRYASTLEKSYVEIYNAFPKKTNRLLWLVTFGHKGKEKKLPFPNPQDLLGKN